MRNEVTYFLRRSTQTATAEAEAEAVKLKLASKACSIHKRMNEFRVSAAEVAATATQQLVPTIIIPDRWMNT